ncbi:MAG: NAD(P)H-hydrate dehydratase [Rhizobiales bacterium]|nr:NAD(P)H-hydrate dehydratase [Hyphomicrobiales bacterium]
MELLTNAEMGEADRLTVAAGISGATLMENAGRAVADYVEISASRAARVAVVAGPGNNGGDGFVAARLLGERGYDVRVLLVGDRTKPKGDAANAAKLWQGRTESASPSALEPAEIVVDALFGAGLDRPVEGSARAMIEAMNRIDVPIVAVDLPSGINGDTGSVMGVAVIATQTVTFFRRKPAHLLMPGRLHCGSISVAQIGIPASVLERIKPAARVNGPEIWATQFPVPRPDGHKYARGHAVVLSGGIATTGAARLAARGALRAGAGLVTIASPREALAVNAATNLAIMVRPVDGAGELSALLTDERLNAVVMGPGAGVGAALRDCMLAVLAAKRSVVADADALTSFAENPASLFAAIGKSGCAAVLTPHDGEFGRLFKAISELPDVNSKLERARRGAKASGAILLLKGPDTVVAAPDGRAAITENAPPWLATAGSGDVLSGIIGGLLAQGMPAFEAACAAAWLHGEAANEFGPGLIAEDLPDALPGVYRRLIATTLSQDEERPL